MVYSKQDRLLKLNEAEFQQEVVLPLLQKLGYRNVRVRHGPNEYGKDIVCQFQTPLALLNVAVVVKRGHLSGAISPKSSKSRPTTRFADVREQVHQAFNIPIDDAAEKSQTKVNSVIVWISGSIRSNVHHQVVHDQGNNYANVEFKDGPATVELLNLQYPEYWTIGDFNISTYFANARKKYSELQELLALGLQGTRRQLLSVFVEPRIELRERIRSKQAIKEGLPRKRFPLARLLETHPQNVALIGGMGTGKSTALRRILLQIIDNNEKELKKYPLPIFVRFRDLDLQRTDAIRIGLQTEFDSLSTVDEPTDLEDLLDRGKITVLIDGLDELETEDNINAGIDLLLEFTEKYKSARVIFASRSLELLQTRSVLSKFAVYRILHLDFQQIQTLIRKWFENSEKDGEALIKLVSNPMTYASLPHTPLTLALLAVIYDRGIQDLPANLTELLEKYVEIALGRWDMDKGIQQQIEWRIKQTLVGQLAWNIVQTDKFEFLQSDLEDLVEQQRTEIGLTYDSKAIVKEIIERSGLLVPRGGGKYVFKHHSFLSYFAGLELSLRPDSRKIVVENFYDVAWSRIIFFACGIKRDDRSFLLSISKELAIPEESLLYFAMQLGLVTQASFLTPLATKVDLVKRAVYSTVLAWDEIVRGLEETTGSEENQRQVRQVVLLDFVSAHLSLGLGSPILRPALEQIVDEVVAKDHFLRVPNDVVDDVQTEWFTFFLAISCLESEAVESFAQLLDSGVIRNPMLLAFCEFHASFFLDVASFSSDDKQLLLEQVTKTRKRLRKVGKEINRLFDQQPQPISLPASTTQELAR